MLRLGSLCCSKGEIDGLMVGSATIEGQGENTILGCLKPHEGGIGDMVFKAGPVTTRVWRGVVNRDGRLASHAASRDPALEAVVISDRETHLVNMDPDSKIQKHPTSHRSGLLDKLS